MSLTLQTESGIFKHSLLPADAQAGLINEIQDKLEHAVGGDTRKPLLYLAVSNFSYPGPEVFNTPFDFSVQKPEVDSGFDLIGPLPESLAAALAYECQEAAVLSRQRYRNGDPGQLLQLAHIGDGQHHLCFKVGEQAFLANKVHGRLAPAEIVELSASAARITFQVQLNSAQVGILEQESDRQINDDRFADDQQRIQTAAEHLEGVDRGQALLLEALQYSWSTDDKT